jgi:Rrf2 family iron-sulfur cluster assembly transcriptional regulator
MKLPSSAAYTLKALVDLALHQGTGPVPVRTIAKRQGIPVRYLEQLFNRLRKDGLVVAERGPRGGYLLGRPAEAIPVSTIFHTLERTGPSTNGPGLARKNQRSPLRGRRLIRQWVHTQDPTASIWRRVEAAVEATLGATTLGDLISQAHEHPPISLNHRYTFHI